MSGVKIDIERRRFLYINMPLTMAEKQQIVKAAMDRGMAPAAFARKTVLAASMVVVPAEETAA